MTRVRAALLSPITGVAAFVVILCACVGAVLVFKAVDGRKAALRQNELELRNLAHSVAAHAFQSIRSADLTLDAVADQMRYAPAPAAERMLRFLRLRRQGLPQVRDFGVLDTTGHWLYATFPAPPSEDHSQQTYFSVPRDVEGTAVQISAPLVFRGDGPPTVIISRRLGGEDGRFAGVALASLDLSVLAGFYKTFEVGRIGRISLIRIDGRLIADSRDAAPGTEISSPIINQMASASSNSGYGEIVSPLDGLAKFIAWEQSPNYPLIATVSRPQSEVLAAWRKSLQPDAVVALGPVTAVIMVGIALALQFGHRMRTERRLSEGEAKYRLLTENAGDVVMQCEPDGTVSYVSPSIERILGWRVSDWIGQPHGTFVHADDHAIAAAAIARTAGVGALISATYRVLKSDLTHLHVEARFRCAGGAGQCGIIACLRDVSERQRMEDELRVLNRQLGSLATTDGLTGLPNRRALDAALREIADDAAFAVLMIDVDDFKPFNDHFGHIRGDDCLKHVAVMIEKLTREGNAFAARYGGEEFAVILPGSTPQRAEVVADALRLAVRGLAIAHPAAPLRVLTVSVGISFRPRGGPDPLDVLREADLALYEAKRLGRNRTVVFAMLDGDVAPLPPGADPCSTPDRAGSDGTAAGTSEPRMPPDCTPAKGI